MYYVLIYKYIINTNDMKLEFESCELFSLSINYIRKKKL